MTAIRESNALVDDARGRPEAVHGRYGQPCPACGGPVQRIVYASNESNYCPACQTGGKLLAGALSRLLKHDWPRTLDEWEVLKDERRDGGDGDVKEVS